MLEPEQGPGLHAAAYPGQLLLRVQASATLGDTARRGLGVAPNARSYVFGLPRDEGLGRCVRIYDRPRLRSVARSVDAVAIWTGPPDSPPSQRLISFGHATTCRPCRDTGIPDSRAHR